MVSSTTCAGAIRIGSSAATLPTSSGKNYKSDISHHEERLAMQP